MNALSIVAGLVWYHEGDMWVCGVRAHDALGGGPRFVIASHTVRGSFRLYDRASGVASLHASREDAATAAGKCLADDAWNLYSK